MPAGDPAFRRATLDDHIAAMQHGRRCEIIDGVLVDKEMAGLRHARGQFQVGASVGAAFGSPAGRESRRCWDILCSPSIAAPDDQIVEPDVAGWHRVRAPTNDEEFPISVTPDWVCELVCTTHDRDMRQKPAIYQAMRVGHLWLVDLKAEVVTVYRLGPDGYILAGAWSPREPARIEPFDAVEFNTWEFFGFDAPPPVRLPRVPG